MSYSVMKTNEDNEVIYQRTDADGLVRRTCLAHDPEFQSWLSANQSSLPDDIQAKVDDGILTIADAD
jgi:hypothetical protein